MSSSGPAARIHPDAATEHLVKRRADWSGYLFILPNMIGFLAFTFLPVFASLGLAFMRCSLLDEPRFVGLDNFRAILTDPGFWKVVWNTLFLMLGIPVSIAASLGLALLLDRPRRGVVLLRTICFLPTVASGVAVFIIWTLVLRPDTGLLNALLAMVGIAGPDWLSDPSWIKPAMILVGLWTTAGGINMLLYLAALSNVPLELYEAAEIDGADATARFVYITWPMIWPTTFFIIIMSIIAGFQGGFDMVYIMTDGTGGPRGAAVTVDFQIYQNAYVNLKLGHCLADVSRDPVLHADHLAVRRAARPILKGLRCGRTQDTITCSGICCSR